MKIVQYTIPIVLTLILVNSASGLPKKIEADRYLLVAKKASDDGNHKKAVKYYQKIFDLGVEIPGDLYYHYGVSLVKTKNYRNAKQHLGTFLNKVDGKNRFYKKALNLYTDAEENIEKEEALETVRIQILKEKEEEERLISQRIWVDTSKWEKVPIKKKRVWVDTSTMENVWIENEKRYVKRSIPSGYWHEEITGYKKVWKSSGHWKNKN